MSTRTRTRRPASRAARRARTELTQQRRNALLQLAARLPLTPGTAEPVTVPDAPSTQLVDLASGHLTAPVPAPPAAPASDPAPAATASPATPDTEHTITLNPEEDTELVRASCSCGDWVQPNATAERYAKAAGTRHVKKATTEDATA